METIPTLSRDGFITNKNIVIKKLFEYFLTSEYSQSNTFYRNISSMKYILSTNKDPYKLKETMENTLLTLYKRYFTVVDVIIDVSENDDSSTIDLTININCKYDNVSYILNRDITTDGSSITNYDKLLGQLYEEYD
jgi:hypothetical protein